MAKSSVTSNSAPRDVFDEYAKYYDVYYADKNYDRECDFIEAAFVRFGQQPKTLLDLACGTGNHGLRLIERGYHVTGVDMSDAMLSQYRTKADARGMRVELHQQDLRSLNLDRQFDAAVCMFDAIDYLPENADLAAALRRIAAHVRPGGLFVFDFWHAVPILRGHDPVRVREFLLDDGRLLRISKTTLDIARQVAKVEFRVFVFEGDRLLTEFSETHTMRYFLSQEMRFMLEATGWKVHHLCPAFDLDGIVDADAWHLVAIATLPK
jgi:SAM-dependent methyltransferase